MKKSQKELIDYIGDSIRDYEEPYVFGAWEDFNKKEKNRSFPYFRVSAAILIAFISSYVLLRPNNYFQSNKKQLSQIAQQQIKSEKKIIGEINNQPIYSYNTYSNKASITKRAIQISSIIAKDAVIISHILIAPSDIILNFESRDTLTNKNNNAIASSNKEINNQVATDRKKIWDKDGIELPPRTVNYKKWDLNLHLSSSIINNTNATAGIQIGYKMSDNFTVSSGVSIGMLNVTTKTKQLFSTNKSLQSTDIRLTGVEIPLEIKYSLSSHLYTSVGMSSFAVLNDSRTNNYIEQKTITERVQLGPGQFTTKTSVIQHEFSEKASPSSFDKTNHVGFYSFSIGYKNKISKKNSISIEPFIKIPTRSLRDSDIKLDNGGLRVKIGF